MSVVGPVNKSFSTSARLFKSALRNKAVKPIVTNIIIPVTFAAAIQHVAPVTILPYLFCSFLEHQEMSSIIGRHVKA